MRGLYRRSSQLVALCCGDAVARSVLTVVLLATTLVVAGESVPAGAVTQPSCTSAPGLSASTIRLSGVPDNTLVEVFVDGALIEAFGVSGGRSDVGIPAEDTEPHAVTVRLDADPQRIVDCGPVAALPAFPSDIATCSIEGVVDGAPRIPYSFSAVSTPVLVRNGQVIATRDDLGTYVDLSAMPSTKYRYALRFVGAQPTLEIPCGTVTTPARTTAQRLATSRYFESIRLAPYVYLNMRPTCPGCDEPFELYSAVSGSSLTPPVEDCDFTDLSCFPDYVFDPPLEMQGSLPIGHPGVYPPRALGRALAAAISAGKQVELTTDGFGLISSWSIDGYGAEIACVDFDSRPPDFGDTACDLFGQTALVRDAPDLLGILYAHDSPGVARGILRLYDAYFGRTPDVAGARYWVDLAAQGLAPTAIADLFVASRESELSWEAEVHLGLRRSHLRQRVRSTPRRRRRRLLDRLDR
ncbi:MAG: hypothetical protein R2710_13245 [Acidimicrobiales bacterium]